MEEVGKTHISADDAEQPPSVGNISGDVAAYAEHDMKRAHEKSYLKHRAICHAVVKGFDGDGRGVVEKLIDGGGGYAVVEVCPALIGSIFKVDMIVGLPVNEVGERRVGAERT